jgi:hypothetical protein
MYFTLAGYPDTLPQHNDGISAGSQYGEWILSVSQWDFDDLYVSHVVTWDNKTVYYNSSTKTYYYFF